MKSKRTASAYEKREKELNRKGLYTAQKEAHEQHAQQHADASKAVDPDVEQCE